MEDEAKKMEYLTQHRIPNLLDDIITELLKAYPTDPSAFIRELDLGNKYDGKAGGGSQPATIDPQGRRGSGVGVRFGAGLDSPDNKPKKKAGVSVMGEAGGGGGGGGEGGGKKDGDNKSKADQMKIKSFRKEFFQSYLNEEWNTVSNIRAVHIGCIALALSYLIKGKMGDIVKNRVTTEDVFFHAHLPLHYTLNAGITLAELYEIAVNYVKNDERFNGKVDISLVHFDTRLYEGEVDQTNTVQSGDRGPCVTLNQFRKALERDSRDDRRIRVFNFDPYVAEQGSMPLDEDDDEDDEDMTEAEKKQKQEEKENRKKGMAKKKNRGAYAVFADVNPFKSTVMLSDVYLDHEIKTKKRECLLPALYKSCCALDAFSKRPRGYIEFRGDADNFENVELDPDDEVDTHWKAPAVVDTDVLDAVPATSVGTSLIDVANHISPHVTAIAWSLHCINASAGKGIDVGDLMSTNSLPLHMLTNDQMSVDQVYQYAQSYLERKGMSNYRYSSHPISGGGDAAPSMSVMDLEKYLTGVMGANPDPKNPNCLMLLNFDVNSAHNVLGLDQGSVPSHWAIFVSYDEKDQMIRVADVMPKKFCKYWQLPLTRLHTAVIGKGFLLLCKGAIPTFVGKSSGANTVTSDKSQPVVANALSAFEFPSSIYCITIIALALARLGHITMVEEVIARCGIDISFLLSDHVSIWDIARIAQYFCAEKKYEYKVEVAINDKDKNGNPHFTEADFEKVVTEHVKKMKSDQREECLVVNYAAEIVHPAQVFYSNNGGDFGIVLDYIPSTKTIQVCDLNPKRFFRTWSVSLASVYKGMADPDYASKRPRGYMLVSRGRDTFGAGKGYNIRKMKNMHPLKSPTSPQITSLAFAITELGITCSPENIFYTAYDQMSRQASTSLDIFSLNTLKTRLTLPDMVELAKATLQKNGKKGTVNPIPVDSAHPPTLDQFEKDVQSGMEKSTVVAAVYTSTIAHDTAGTVSAGLIQQYDSSTKKVTIAEVNPTKYGAEWTCSLGHLLEACKGDNKNKGLVRIAV